MNFQYGNERPHQFAVLLRKWQEVSALVHSKDASLALSCSCREPEVGLCRERVSNSWFQLL